MPITKDRAGRYPKDWPAIADRIKERAGWRCEGSPAFPDCRARHGETNPLTGARVVLTVAHLNHAPEDCADENLRAWCQLCHNTYDAPFRARNAARTRRRRSPQMDIEEWLEGHGGPAE